MEISKLKVKVGPHEFEAEGSQDEVSAQFKIWQQMISAIPVTPQGELHAPVKQPSSGIPLRAITEVKTRDGYAAPWDIFSSDGDKALMTLSIHPPAGDTRDGDAILLVLYGYRKSGNDGAGVVEVPVTKLKESLDVSGLRLPRIDRAAANYIKAGYLLKGGRGKGGTYRLTNTGYQKAEELAMKLFEQLV